MRKHAETLSCSVHGSVDMIASFSDSVPYPDFDEKGAPAPEARPEWHYSAQQVTDSIHERPYSAASGDYFLEFLHKNDNIKVYAKSQCAAFERKRNRCYIHVGESRFLTKLAAGGDEIDDRYDPEKSIRHRERPGIETDPGAG